ncbi:MAG: anthrax toxin lethal factor-related metalloendopeptidase [Anaerostipes hadrus]
MLIFGGVTFYNNHQQEKFEKQMASFESVDTMKHPKESTIKIDGVEVPLSKAPKVTTKTTTKRSKKVQKLKKKASKSKVTTTKKTRTTKKTTQSSSQRKVVDTKVVTTTKDYDKKGSNKRTVETVVQTTVKTTTVQLTQTGSTGTTVRTLGAKADKKILDAFDTLKFKLVINKNASHTGVFSVKNHKIEIQSAKDYVLLHELGHFANFLAGDKVSTSEWNSIYKAEKSKYTGYNKTYVTKTASEYFAESYRDYKENPTALKSKRPRTYQFVKKTIDGISSSNVQEIKDTYGEYWGL